MKRTVLLSTILLLTCMSFYCSAQEPVSPDNLWSKAVEIATRNSHWIAGSMQTSVVVKDKKGKVLESEDTEIRLFVNNDGEIQSEVVSGGDTTSVSSSSQKENDSNHQDNEKEEDSQEFGLSINPSDNVFNTEVQDQVTATATTRRKEVGNQVAIAYEYTFRKKQGETEKGTAWLHETTGRPLAAEFTIDPLPKHTQAMDTVVRYSAQSGDPWYVIRMDMTGSGGFLWIKRQFEMHIVFSNHFEHNIEKTESIQKNPS